MILFLVLLGVVVAVISAPLRGRATGSPSGEQFVGRSASNERGAERLRGGGAVRAELEAAREAKYREIRDSELDFRTGKLSPEDFAAIDAQLRAEALAILDRIEALDPDAAHPGPLAPPGPPAPGGLA